MEQREFSGKTTEEALQSASEFYHLPLSSLKVEVVSAGSNGLFGIFGGKKAKVLVKPVKRDSADEVADIVGELSGKRPRRRPEKQTEERFSEERSTKSKPWERDQEAEEKEKAEEEPEVVDSAREVLMKLALSLDETVKVSAKASNRGIELEMDTEEAGIMIGRRGQTLEALQYLTTRIVSHKYGRPVRILVDAGGYRKRREESLQELAMSAAEKARRNKRPQAVGPFNAQERRLIHLTLRHENGIATASRGRGELKKVVISPR